VADILPDHQGRMRTGILPSHSSLLSHQDPMVPRSPSECVSHFLDQSSAPGVVDQTGYLLVFDLHVKQTTAWLTDWLTALRLFQAESVGNLTKQQLVIVNWSDGSQKPDASVGSQFNWPSSIEHANAIIHQFSKISITQCGKGRGQNFITFTDYKFSSSRDASIPHFGTKLQAIHKKTWKLTFVNCFLHVYTRTWQSVE